MSRTLVNNRDWKDYSLVVIRDLPTEWRGTGEDIRSLVDAEPRHPNAWGALVNAAQKLGYLHPTGEYIPMTAKKSHGRRTPVYTRIAA